MTTKKPEDDAQLRAFVKKGMADAIAHGLIREVGRDRDGNVLWGVTPLGEALVKDDPLGKGSR